MNIFSVQNQSTFRHMFVDPLNPSVGSPGQARSGHLCELLTLPELLTKRTFGLSLDYLCFCPIRLSLICCLVFSLCVDPCNPLVQSFTFSESWKKCLHFVLSLSASQSCLQAGRVLSWAKQLRQISLPAQAVCPWKHEAYLLYISYPFQAIQHFSAFISFTFDCSDASKSPKS